MFNSWKRRLTENAGLIVAIAAATIALWSAKIQRDALQLDQRPYLKVAFDRIEPTKRGDGSWDGYDAHVVVEVSGKTPAFHIAAHGSCVAREFLARSGKGDTDNGLTWRLWPFLFGEKQGIMCHYQHDLPDGDLPLNVPFDLNVQYDDIFKRHHVTTFCEIIITGRGERLPRRDAAGTVECDDFQFVME